MHNQIRSLQTYRSFNQLISNHLKDFTLDDIQTIKDAKDLKVASDPLRKAGVRVLAVGIGSGVDADELRSITETDEDVVVAADFTDLLYGSVQIKTTEKASLRFDCE